MSPEQIDEFFGQTLTGDYDDESPWAAVHALRREGSRWVIAHDKLSEPTSLRKPSQSG
jgi:hypothetical protein